MGVSPVQDAVKLSYRFTCRRALFPSLVCDRGEVTMAVISGAFGVVL